MEPKELEKIIKIAKKHGAKSLEVNGVKLEFASSPALGNPAEVKLPATGSAAGDPISLFSDSEPAPSDSEMLMWSSPYFNVMQADKEASLAPERVPS